MKRHTRQQALQQRLLPTRHLQYVMAGTSKYTFCEEEGDLWAQGFMAGWLHPIRPRAWFDIHRPETVNSLKPWNPSYQSWLRDQKEPVIMMFPQEYPDAIPYPREDIEKTFPEAPFAGSVDWAIALGLWLGARKISLYGVDYDSIHELLFQRFGVAYWIGFARGAGITVSIPTACPVLNNIIPGQYGPDFPPWPAEAHPEFATFESWHNQHLLRRFKRI